LLWRGRVPAAFMSGIPLLLSGDHRRARYAPVGR
jgi:hypothetical protein